MTSQAQRRAAKKKARERRRVSTVDRAARQRRHLECAAVLFHSDMDEASHGELDLTYMMPFKALERGEGTEENRQEVIRALCTAWHLAESYDQVEKIRDTIELAFVTIVLVYQDMVEGKLTKEYFDPIRAALDAYSDMQRDSSRWKLFLKMKKDRYSSLGHMRRCDCAVFVPDGSKVTDETVWRCKDRHGRAWLHCRAVRGVFTYDDRGFGFVDDETGAWIRVDRPTPVIFKKEES